MNPNASGIFPLAHRLQLTASQSGSRCLLEWAKRHSELCRQPKKVPYDYHLEDEQGVWNERAFPNPRTTLKNDRVPLDQTSTHRTPTAIHRVVLTRKRARPSSLEGWYQFWSSTRSSAARSIALREAVPRCSIRHRCWKDNCSRRTDSTNPRKGMAAPSQ